MQIKIIEGISLSNSYLKGCEKFKNQYEYSKIGREKLTFTTSSEGENGGNFLKLNLKRVSKYLYKKTYK